MTQPLASELDEVRKFEEMAHQWWDPDGKFRLLHQINPARLGYIRTRLRGDDFAMLDGLKVVDIGCGGGILSESLSDAGASVVGLDRSDKIIGVAKSHQAESGSAVDYRVQSAKDMAKAEPARYDAVFAMEVLEHVPDVPDFISDCAALLKPGGHFFFATINRTPKAWLAAIAGAEYILGWLPRGTHQFEKFLKPSEVHAHCRKNGILVKDITGMTLSGLADGWRLDKSTEVNYLGYGIKGG